MPNIKFNPEKLKDAYNWPVYYRELGYYVKQREEYERSLKFFDESLKKDPDCVRTLHGRVDARAKSIKFSGALEDIQRILNVDPDNIYLRGQKALLTYLVCEFETALVQNFRNVPLRKKPDNFVMGVMHCENAIMNCISERAGKPLRDHFKLIRQIAWTKTLEKQRPYRPVALLRKKKKKSVYMNLPTTQRKKIDKEDKKKEKVQSNKERTRRSTSSNEGKIFSASIAMFEESSSIMDTLGSHEDSLANFRVPLGAPFPYSPLQRHTSNIENYLAERYLDKLYHDKSFLKHLPTIMGATIANQKGSDKIIQLAKRGFKNISQTQEILRARRPFYFIKYQEATTCGKLDDRKKQALKLLQDAALKQANFIMSKIENAVQDRRLRRLLESVEKFITFVESTTKKIFPTRQAYLSKMVELLCEGFYEMKKFSKNMTDEEKDTRVKIVLGLPMEKYPSTDSLATDLRDWFINWKKMTAIYKKRLFRASSPEEFAWLYHELSRFSFEMKQYELSRMYARKCITEANLCKKLKWILNAMLLIVRIDILQRNKNDAKTQVKHARKVANRMKDADMLELLERCIEAIEQSTIDDVLGIKVLEMREKNIVKLLTTQQMKDEAVLLFRRIATLPPTKRMSVMPGFTYADKSRKTSSSSDSLVSDVSKKSKKVEPKQRGIGFLDLIL
ncbi:hypothetical protein HHI36_010972 [Cryptolaemus montrouzieri]|uniref:Tetratricopeptide repeat protein 25 n=1 Tax=Cryptolaemus montrouzieri TaxID=559131 RepID=A0ABD2MKD9_9CUCU